MSNIWYYYDSQGFRQGPVDSDLDTLIGETAVQRKQRSQGNMSYEDALHLVCREQLEEWGYGNELEILGKLFDEVRCFSVSAYGHMPGQNRKFEAKRVMLPLFWCLQHDINNLIS